MEVRTRSSRLKRGPIPVPPPRVPTPRPVDTPRLKIPEEVALNGKRVEMVVPSTRISERCSGSSKENWINPRLLSKVEECREARRETWLYMGTTRLETKFTLATTHTSAAAAFFARATQKLNLSSGGSPQRRKRGGGWAEEESGGFSQALARHPPQLPPPLLRRIGSKELSGLGKVRVILKVCESVVESSVLNVDSKKRQITLFDPAACGASSLTPEDRRLGVAAPKMFAFDAIFSDQDSQTELCSAALSDLIHAVINGSDGCLFCYGHPRNGKSETMVGSPENSSRLGVVPCAISWLFKCISEQKQKSGTRFSVRVSALEVAAQSLKDLLSQHASENDQSPGIYLCEGALQSYCELRAPSAEKAAFYLDTALATRTSEHSHLFYTLHVYQYSVAGKGGVAGGRSRLHLVDLASSERSKVGAGLPLSAIGNVLLAIFNGQKHLPHKDHKLTQQLKECLGSLTCHAAMIAHVSPHAASYTDTLTTVQLASRIHRMRRRKFKFMGNSGAIAGEDVTRLTGSSDVDPSSSEQSADTVIYVGPTEETDGEHPPVYIPSLNSGDNRCAMGKVLRGSYVDQKLKVASKSVPASPQKTPIEDKSNFKKTQKPNSTKSSPARTVKPTPREEQWVDGPRILKSRVTEGRNLVKGKKETWVDGPKMSNGHTSYGFMDYHKKSMIRKWVENQSILVAKPRQGYKEMTVFKTCEEVRGRGSGQEDEGLPSSSSSHMSISHLPTNKVLPLERLPCSGVENEDEEEDEGMEVEIIEIEEPAEPVPMQDSCLQVTEEDIALCMGELENPLPEVDQEEHPLRILSQENLTVVSTFTDSLSVANDLERLFPRNSRIFKQTSNGWSHQKETKEIFSNKYSHFEQLNKLHELYNGRTGRSEQRPVSRCQSLMFSELITELPKDFDTNSIASEPAYLPQDAKKLCDNCKINLENAGDMTDLWFKDDSNSFETYHQSSRSISSLRHPDGASNPNLGELCKREPGNGAEKAKDLLQTKLEDDEEITVPPPLHSNLLTLNREGFEYMKNKCQDNLDLTNGLVHDPGGKGLQNKTNVEGWRDAQAKCPISSKELNKGQTTKPESGAKHKLLFPFGHGGILNKSRGNFNSNVSSRNANPPQTS